jgi:polysaccharide biosynthesis/export protein
VFKFIKVCVVFLFFAMVAMPAFAVTPSPAMIEQFKQLPKAEQEKLAGQYGIDLRQITATELDESSATAEPLQQSDKVVSKQHKQSSALSVAATSASRRFGMNMFDPKISTFAPVDNMPVPQNYILGPDDVLMVQLYGKETNKQGLRIGRDGLVQLDDVGPIQLAGLSFSDAAALIESKISTTKIGVNAAVSMGQLRTINIFIAGEARFPGMYAVSAMTTVTQALFVGGGVSEIGSLRQIEVKRHGSTIGQFDLYELLLSGNNQHDIHLQHGDVVFVTPVNALVDVDGEVNRSAIYEIKKGESIADVLKMAGGTKSTAHLKSAALERVNVDNLKVLKNIDLTQSADLALAMQDGDQLRIAKISSRIENEVVLAGAVVRPGRYAYRAGMQLNDIIRGVWSDLLPTVDLDYLLVLREINAKGDVETLQLNLADTLGLNSQNLGRPFVLQPRDIIVVFHHGIEKTDKTNADVTVLEGSFKAVFSDSSFLSQSPLLTRQQMLQPILDKLRRQATNQMPLAIASVFGDVKVPGEYPIASNSAVKDLIIAAGGVKDSAFLQRAELSRYEGQSTSDNKMVVSNINVNLAEIDTYPEQNIALKSRDRLNVLSMPDWSINRTITISGEVRFPGTYQLTKGETLSQLIERAGGFNDYAFPFGAVFTRAKIQAREQVEYQRLLNQLKVDIATRTLSSSNSTLGGASVSPEQSIKLIDQLAQQQMAGRLVIDMTQIEAGNPEYDLEVEAGDSLYIPRKNSAISVVGEVQNPGTHSYNVALTVSDYLELSGNGRKRADTERVYILRANGSVFVPSRSYFSSTDQKLMPGDTIVVPLDIDYKDGLSLWSQITQVFYQSAIALAAIHTF